jgi:hypothetical protein
MASRALSWPNTVGRWPNGSTSPGTIRGFNFGDLDGRKLTEVRCPQRCTLIGGSHRWGVEGGVEAADECVSEQQCTHAKLQAVSAWPGCRRRRPAPERSMVAVRAYRDGGGRPVSHGWARPKVKDGAWGHQHQAAVVGGSCQLNEGRGGSCSGSRRWTEVAEKSRRRGQGVEEVKREKLSALRAFL